ncbi:MAG: hypothetical protein KDA92_13105 [Planctomycetales bacterium]|nr:hypothetical protein [Planctomycetales bacterium]
MSIPSVAQQAAVRMRKPQIANPYGNYPRICGLIVIASLFAGAVALRLPPTAMAMLLGFSIAVGSIALLSGIILLPFVRAGQRQVESLAAGECLAYWKFPAEAWNKFAAEMRTTSAPQLAIPWALFPACGLGAGWPLAITQHWVWLPIAMSIGVALAVVSWYSSRRIHSHKYRDVAHTAEVFITQGMLAMPGQAFIWNRLAPQLVGVRVDAKDKSRACLVFRVASQVKHHKIFNQIVVPIPAAAIHEAYAVAAALSR